MAMISTSTDPRQSMVDQQLLARGIADTRVIEAMRWLPREKFMPATEKAHAYADKALPIGHGQSISQPYVVAMMSEALDVHPTHRVLEIGTGSGYQAALLAHLAREVYTVERLKPLLDLAFETILSLHLRNVHFRFGDGSLGWPEQGPFDRILITAATHTVSQALLDQLADNGRLVAPVGKRNQQQVIAITRSGTHFDRRDLGAVKFVPLIGEGGWPA